jgi:hypothetical protein
VHLLRILRLNSPLSRVLNLRLFLRFRKAPKSGVQARQKIFINNLDGRTQGFYYVICCIRSMFYSHCINISLLFNFAWYMAVRSRFNIWGQRRLCFHITRMIVSNNSFCLRIYDTFISRPGIGYQLSKNISVIASIMSYLFSRSILITSHIPKYCPVAILKAKVFKSVVAATMLIRRMVGWLILQ